jgi:hypothetical protein
MRWGISPEGTEHRSKAFRMSDSTAAVILHRVKAFKVQSHSSAFASQLHSFFEHSEVESFLAELFTITFLFPWSITWHFPTNKHGSSVRNFTLTLQRLDEVKVILRPAVSRSVCLGVKPPSEAQDQILVTVSWEFVDLGRPLWRENGSVVYNYYWPSPAQSFSGPSPSGLMTIIYCLGFETPLDHVLVFISPRNRVAQLYPQELCSLFVVSYDWQGYRGINRTRLHTS